METLGCIYAWAMWEEQEEQLEVPSIQISSTPGFVILALILAPLINLHPAIASTLLTQANQNQSVTTSQNDPQPEVEGANGTQPSETVNSEEICKAAMNSRYLRIGSVGEEVRLLQIQLNNWGFPVKKVDGIFGPETCAAVVQFQNFRGLNPDGILGPKTSQALWTSRTDNVQMLQAQLNNWGFSVKNVDNILDDETRTALVRFQEYRGLESSGIVDRETSQALWTPRTEAIAQQPPAVTNTSEQVLGSQDSAEDTSQNSSANNLEQSLPAENPTDPSVGSVHRGQSTQVPSTENSSQESSVAQHTSAESSTPNSSTENPTENQTTESNPQNGSVIGTVQDPSDNQNQLAPSPQEPPIDETQGTSQTNNQNVASKGNCAAFINALGDRESGKALAEFGNESYRAVADNTGNIGRYQFGEALLKDLGYYSVEHPYLKENVGVSGKLKNTWNEDRKDKDADGQGIAHWTELAQSYGISRDAQAGREDFLNNKNGIQDQAIKKAFTLNWFYFEHYLSPGSEGYSEEYEKFKAKYLDSLNQGEEVRIENLKVTKSGLLAAFHLIGAHESRMFLLGERPVPPQDENGTSIEEYLNEFSGYDVQGCMSRIKNENKVLQEWQSQQSDLVD
ncbi:peptidoglycan-binding protein [Leptolyngbya sp. FACHB-671]|uniref:peptidoglycan-binding domain-containing protein n=1 Tax=Leptolyngbya sp. FACHB-671 TaxID=2692812 RepID=UPI0016852382|nr:peptidoglycan-binding protein [Leptolyngbya sp. FACHB-671]MBD2068243.1 peptidoglycan-binding protein [Leptolyngbya sp. FACHB-671]